ncbi:hypothetical protein FSP39_009830 [Pinctada imbricata]|uniref:Uncharacterized protein n=1 Tax=Pinctada imbricata TaxID=66713 RepID=A0AA88YCN1_PINIB|nr:hypothetical protein FSP39_009830 [Pinctada imbricata]
MYVITRGVRLPSKRTGGRDPVFAKEVWTGPVTVSQSASNISCPSGFLSMPCMSLFQGHGQECTDDRAAGGWITCLEVNPPCSNRADYWINKDEVTVKDGCGGQIQACYTTDIPQTNIRTRVIECRHWNNDYKECEIEGASLVDKIELRGEFALRDGVKCNQGHNYGIYKNTVWIKDGCNGHFSVDFYPDHVDPIPIRTPAPTLPTTTKTTSGPDAFRTTRTSHNATFPTSRHSTTAVHVTAPPPGRVWTDGLMGVTIGVLCGAFLMLLLTFLGVLWFARRRRYLNKEKKTHVASFRREEPPFIEDDRQYEEIHPRDSLHYESAPFIGQQASKPLTTNRMPEQNNNPANPHGENYFILEPNDRPCVFHHPTSRPPSIPPDHLIPLRQKYMLQSQQCRPPSESPLTTTDSCSRVSPASRASNGSNTIGHIPRHSPHAFYPVCNNYAGQFSLDRKPNKCCVNRTASVSSQTDSGLEYHFESDDEGYDRVEEFRKLARNSSKHSHYCDCHDHVQIPSDDGSDVRHGSVSTFKRSDRTSC